MVYKILGLKLGVRLVFIPINYYVKLPEDDDSNGQVTAPESQQFPSYGSAAPSLSTAPHRSPALPLYSSSACGEYETWAPCFLRLALGIASLDYTSMELLGVPTSATSLETRPQGYRVAYLSSCLS